jgi:large subunit ribosomal protein L25
MDLKIDADPRSVSGKHTKRLRSAGIVPGVLFGKKAGSVPLQVDAKTFELLYREAGRTQIVKVSVGGGRATSAVIKSVQRHPLTGRALHVDFFAPDLTHEMTTEVPLVYTGEAPGVELTGGYLLTSLDQVRVRALPADVPHEITVDVGPLVDLEAAIHVRDLVVDTEKVHILNDPDEMVARVMPPRVEVEPEPTVAEEAEEAAEAAAEEGAEGEAAVEAGEQAADTSESSE